MNFDFNWGNPYANQNNATMFQSLSSQPNWNQNMFNWTGGQGLGFSGTYGGYTPMPGQTFQGGPQNPIANPWQRFADSMQTGFQKVGGFFGSEGFQNTMGGLAALGQFYMGIKGIKNMERQWKVHEKNWNATVTDYNNQLKDQWTSRSARAQLVGEQFENMDDWVAARSIGTNKKQRKGRRTG